MNKQEVIEKIETCKTEYDCETRDVWCYKKGFEDARSSALNIIKQLDEPEKPVLNKYEAKWIEALKESFPSRETQLYYITRYGLGCHLTFNYHDKPFTLSYKHCRDIGQGTIKRRLVDAILYGYEVEKEKLYTVELPNPNSNCHVVLCKNSNGNITIEYDYDDDWATGNCYQLTEAEIKENYEWTWQFAEEVKE